MSEPDYVTDAVTCKRCGIVVKRTYAREAVCRKQVAPHPDLLHDWIATPRSTIVIRPEYESFASWLSRNLTIT